MSLDDIIIVRELCRALVSHVLYMRGLLPIPVSQLRSAISIPSDPSSRKASKQRTLARKFVDSLDNILDNISQVIQAYGDLRAPFSVYLLLGPSISIHKESICLQFEGPLESSSAANSSKIIQHLERSLIHALIERCSEMNSSPPQSSWNYFFVLCFYKPFAPVTSSSTSSASLSTEEALAPILPEDCAFAYRAAEEFRLKSSGTSRSKRTAVEVKVHPSTASVEVQVDSSASSDSPLQPPPPREVAHWWVQRRGVRGIRARDYS